MDKNIVWSNLNWKFSKAKIDALTPRNDFQVRRKEL